MLIVYAAGDGNNVTVSPRLGAGHFEPAVNQDAQVSVLEGTGILPDGTLVANIRCDTCLNWNGGSMDPTDASSRWIYAHKTGDALRVTGTDAELSQHNDDGGFSLDLTAAIGGSSTNPFVSSVEDSSSSAAPSASAIPSQTATIPALTTATMTGNVSNPLASSGPSSTSSSERFSEPDKQIRVAHAVIMSLIFIGLFPLSALTVYLPYHEKVRHVHAPLQIISLLLMIVGLGTGIELARNLGVFSGYHQAFGYVIVAWLAIFQPALGLGQHLHFRKRGTRSPMGQTHRWLGRLFILLGIVNGGLGLKQSGSVGDPHTPMWSVVAYAVLAAISFVFYTAIVCWSPATSKAAVSNSLPGEKQRPRTQDYELHSR